MTYLSDALANIKPLKAMAKQSHFRSLFDTKNALLRRALRKQVVSRHALTYLQEVLVTLIGGLTLVEYLGNVALDPQDPPC